METPSLFDNPLQLEPLEPVVAKVERKSHPLAPWFEAIAQVIGPTAAKVSAGRVLKIAKAMKEAGLAPERVSEVGDVVRLYAAWRKVIDLSAVQSCWPWILEPPLTTADPKPTSFDLLASVMNSNGGRLLK